MADAFPVAITHGSEIIKIFRVAEAFDGPDGVQHPADVWGQRRNELPDLIAPWSLAPVTEVDQPNVELHLVRGQTMAIVDGAVVLGWDSTAYPAAELADRTHKALMTAAMIELNKVTSASGTIMRCVAAGIAVPEEWTDYVKALRAITNGTDTARTALPARPPYPEGT